MPLAVHLHTQVITDLNLAIASAHRATPEQIGNKNLWYVEVKLDPDVAQEITTETKTMTGQQLAFIYDGAVLTSIAVDSNFHPAHFAITGDYDKASATKLAQELTA